MTTLQPMTPAPFVVNNILTMIAAVNSIEDMPSEDSPAKREEENVESESEKSKSPPHGFNGNHEEQKMAAESKEKASADLSILADAAAKSPVNSVPKDTLEAPSDIPFPGDNDATAAGSKRPAVSQKKPAAKKPKKPPAAKAKTDTKTQKRPARARKLPTKLKQRPSSMTSSSSAMSAAAILVQVSGSKGEGKKKRVKKKPTEGGDSDIRGITMKRPGKWVSVLLLLLVEVSRSASTIPLLTLLPSPSSSFFTAASAILLCRTISLYWNLY